eukprot:TRINITY_DN1753_c0_g3_i1.p1 TRINITY_DN1753_c0_g3~~TRINITY_DN1753_c0_g3_i1.p1  ORF type:complete len:303 (+),score=84.96 TRINITY_DN1753_c0_g3_i1:54-962(+)
MTLLFLALLLGTLLCQDKPLLGYISIDGKLVSEIIGNAGEPIKMQVGIKELFGITLATTSPLRWYLYTPEAYPYILCKQKIIDKNEKTEEVIQIFGCKMPYKGESFITIGLGTSDSNVKTPRKIDVRINVNASLEDEGPKLTQEVPTIIPTVPPPEEVKKSRPVQETPQSNNNRNQQNQNVNRKEKEKKERERKERERKEKEKEEKDKKKEKEKEKESSPYNNYQRDYIKRMQDYFKSMRDDFRDDDYFDEDYWSPSRYRSRNNRSPFGGDYDRSPYGSNFGNNRRGFPYDSLYDDDYIRRR